MPTDHFVRYVHVVMQGTVSLDPKRLLYWRSIAFAVSPVQIHGAPLFSFHIKMGQNLFYVADIMLT